MKNSFLIVRNSDHAIFQPLYHQVDLNTGTLLHRVSYKARRWWQRRGRFVRTGEEWRPDDDHEYECVDQKVIEAGFTELCRRTGKKELQ
jgi:hypothetical protein